MATTLSGSVQNSEAGLGEFCSDAAAGSPSIEACTTSAAVWGLLGEQDELESGLDLVQPFPEVTSIPGWTPPMTLQVLDASELTPKEEALTYRQHVQLFRWRQEEWKERGAGEAMLLKNKETGFTRFLMWQDGTYKTIANFNIIESLSQCRLRMHEGDPKTLEWSCQDHSDNNSIDEKFVLRFRNAELASQFTEAFDGAKKGFNKDSEALLAVAKADDSLSTSHTATKWECNGCFLQVSSDNVICPCCEHPLQKAVVEVTAISEAMVEVTASASGSVASESGSIAAGGGNLDECLVSKVAALQL